MNEKKKKDFFLGTRSDLQSVGEKIHRQTFPWQIKKKNRPNNVVLSITLDDDDILHFDAVT